MKRKIRKGNRKSSVLRKDIRNAVNAIKDPDTEIDPAFYLLLFIFGFNIGLIILILLN